MTAIKPKILKKDGKQRIGRGFSREELKKAESTPNEALRFGMLVDAKRKTAHEENIEAIKVFIQEKKRALKLEELKSKEQKPKEQKPKKQKSKEPTSKEPKPKRPKGKPKS